MKWFTAKAQADDPRKALVVIDKPIGSDWAPDWIADFTGEQPARDFISAVDALGELDEITVELNSPGGDVASGVRIFNYLRDHSAKVHTRVTGTAASIATVIMMAGDTRSMAIGSNMMTHRASALMIGFFNAQEMTDTARNLSSIDASMVDIYTATTGKDKDEINGLLDQGDTYMGAEEAIEWGFATHADAELRAVACTDPRLYMKQLEQSGEIAKLRAQIAGKSGETGGEITPGSSPGTVNISAVTADVPSTMTAADALALAFDLTPEQAEAQAADLGDQIIALRAGALSDPEAVAAAQAAARKHEITAEYVAEHHPEVAEAIKAAALADITPAPDPTEVVAAERTRITAIVKACQTTGQTQLLEKLVDNGMPEAQASEYIYDVAAASGNRYSIHNSHSPEGGHKASIDYAKIYARQNRAKATA